MRSSREKKDRMKALHTFCEEPEGIILPTSARPVRPQQTSLLISGLFRERQANSNRSTRFMLSRIILKPMA
jgi:hypothetical protein